jgi:hypothetical protein
VPDADMFLVADSQTEGGAQMAEQPTVFYTKGDIAKVKLVSNTAVTRWDLKGFLTPAAVTVGGIKLYTQASVEKLDELRGV